MKEIELKIHVGMDEDNDMTSKFDLESSIFQMLCEAAKLKLHGPFQYRIEHKHWKCNDKEYKILLGDLSLTSINNEKLIVKNVTLFAKNKPLDFKRGVYHFTHWNICMMCGKQVNRFPGIDRIRNKGYFLHEGKKGLICMKCQQKEWRKQEND